MSDKSAAFLSDLTNTNRTVVDALTSKVWIRPIAAHYKLKDRVRFINIFRNIPFSEDGNAIHVDNMHMLRKLSRRVNRFNKRFLKDHLRRHRNVSRQCISVRVLNYPMHFDIHIAAEVFSTDEHVYSLFDRDSCIRIGSTIPDEYFTTDVFEL